ncbi:MAG TPA: hypothetical protein VGF44_13635 [Terriglobales bacterium]|jgi:hypothetical protein
MEEREKTNVHSRIDELCAMAASGLATPQESEELTEHLKACASCCAIYQDYLVLVKDGMPMLAARYAQLPDIKLLGPMPVRGLDGGFSGYRESLSEVPGFSARNLGLAAAAVFLLAVCMTLFVSGKLHSLLASKEINDHQSVPVQVTQATSQIQFLNSSMTDLQNHLIILQVKYDRKQAEITKMAEELKASEARANDANVSKAVLDQQLASTIQQQDALRAQLGDIQQQLQNAQVELANLRVERETAVLRTSSLETKLGEMSIENRDRERRLKDAEQYLDADRDIREMMGARKLYIADLFDVDSRSVTRKSFGRVFYAQGKSLVFYAFDLEPPSGMKNASFQAWGQKEVAEGAHRQPPRSLGILYVDSESNHRWVLSCDDPKQLTEIDNVFVTVEPEGGSRKPTGKPLLYALLRKEVNHP